MKNNELINKSKEELNHLLTDLRSKILRLNFNMAEKKVKDFSQLKKVKKDIARILTVLNKI